jgi:hypothetical protein
MPQIFCPMDPRHFSNSNDSLTPEIHPSFDDSSNGHVLKERMRYPVHVQGKEGTKEFQNKSD